MDKNVPTGREVIVSTKRQEIIKQTACLIHAKGYESTKLSDILEACNIGKGQFYHYFSSKHELGLAVLDDVYSRWSQKLLINILASDEKPDIKLDQMFEWVINLQMDTNMHYGCFFGNLALEMSEHDEQFREKLKLVFDAWIKALNLVLRDYLPTNTDEKKIEFLSQNIVALIEGGTVLMKNYRDIQYLQSAIEACKILMKQV